MYLDPSFIFDPLQNNLNTHFQHEDVWDIFHNSAVYTYSMCMRNSGPELIIEIGGGQS